MRARVCGCVRACVRVRACARARARARACARAHSCACACACVRVRVRASVPVCLRLCLFVILTHRQMNTVRVCAWLGVSCCLRALVVYIFVFSG